MKAIEVQGSRLYKIMNMPIDFLTACKDAIVSLFLVPFRFVSKWFSRVGKAGESIGSAIQQWIEWLFSLPNQIWSKILNSLGSISISLGPVLGNQRDAVWSWLRSSPLRVYAVSVIQDLSNLALLSFNYFSDFMARTRIQWILVNEKIAGTALAVEVYSRKFVELFADNCSWLALAIETHSKKICHHVSRDYKTANCKLADWSMRVELYVRNLSDTIRGRL
jgi:hypothetical protein